MAEASRTQRLEISSSCVSDTDPVFFLFTFYQFYNKRQREHSRKQGTESVLFLSKLVIKTH